MKQLIILITLLSNFLFAYEFKLNEIFIPALFNTKHGIESLLKTLNARLLNKSTLDGKDYSHNISEIFFQLKNAVPSHKKKIEASKAFLDNPILKLLG